jgi:hypothetical protein
MAPAAAEEYDGVQIQLEQQRQQKRGAIPAETVVKILPKQEHVCETVIRTDYRPLLGQGQNGTRIEIQQDEERQFRATFIECKYNL